MLYVYKEATISDVRKYFDDNYELEWFDNADVQSVIYMVDKAKFKDGLVSMPQVSGVPVTYLSVDAKALVLLLMLPDEVVDASFCSGNMAEYLYNVSKEYDLHIKVDYCIFPADIEAEFPELGVRVHDCVGFRAGLRQLFGRRR